MIKNSYIPGDKWLYYKVYCGSKTADKILTDSILPLTESLLKVGIIKQWFFIRYTDPDLHLRIRFEITDIMNIGKLMQVFNNHINRYVICNKVWKVTCDTYQPELERYHPKAILLGEELFCADSIFTANFLDLIKGDAGEQIRWMVSFLSIDILLSDFNFSIEKKLQLLDRIKTSFANEFGMNKMLKQQLDKKYRRHTKDIQLIMDLSFEKANEYTAILDLLRVRSVTNGKIKLELDKLNEIDNSVNIDNLLISYIHMLMNRLFRTKQRVHELVVYNFLWRHYRSHIAKHKYSKQNINIKT